MHYNLSDICSPECSPTAASYGQKIRPFEGVDRPEVAYTVPEILEPAKFKQLLATAEEEVPELIPFLAMAGFAGLRRSELVREYAAYGP